MSAPHVVIIAVVFLGGLYIRKILLYLCNAVHWISLARKGCFLEIDFRGNHSDTWVIYNHPDLFT